MIAKIPKNGLSFQRNFRIEIRRTGIIINGSRMQRSAETART
jgi:hypothetical protein